MDIFSSIAERRIRDGIERGEFENLSGSGRPLLFEDESWIPGDLRIAYRVLRNAGCIPPELELRKELLSLRDLMATLDDDEKRMKALRRFNHALLKLSEMRKRPFSLDHLSVYEERLFVRFAGSNQP
ncbi:MAG: DUF1992 domain-containing protein [Thermodesulfovibrionales bacterium]